MKQKIPFQSEVKPYLTEDKCLVCENILIVWTEQENNNSDGIVWSAYFGDIVTCPCCKIYGHVIQDSEGYAAIDVNYENFHNLLMEKIYNGNFDIY